MEEQVTHPGLQAVSIDALLTVISAYPTGFARVVQIITEVQKEQYAGQG